MTVFPGLQASVRSPCAHADSPLFRLSRKPRRQHAQLNASTPAPSKVPDLIVRSSALRSRKTPPERGCVSWPGPWVTSPQLRESLLTAEARPFSGRLHTSLAPPEFACGFAHWLSRSRHLGGLKTTLKSGFFAKPLGRIGWSGAAPRMITATAAVVFYKFFTISRRATRRVPRWRSLPQAASHRLRSSSVSGSPARGHWPSRMRPPARCS